MDSVLLEKLIVTQLVKTIPHFMWNLEVHYRVHKSPTLGPYPEPDASSPPKL